MSGSTIGGAVGAVVGFWVGGPQGAYYGWMIGSAVGAYVDPQQIVGPRLQDIRGTTSAVGGSIPRAWGTAPVPCNIIWQADAIEHKNTESGKGGPEQVTFTYTRSYAVMFHLGEITGVLQIKRNGKIVYDSRDDATLLAEYEAALGPVDTVGGWFNRVRLQRAMNNRWLNKCQIYTGTQTQNPDPTIEAYLGAGNVPSYRGRAYMVVTDDDVTQEAGAIPQFEVIVSSCGIVNEVTGSTWMLAFNGGAGVGVVKESPDGLDWSAAAVPVPLLEGGAFGPNGSGFLENNGAEVLATSASAVLPSLRFAFRDSDGVWHQVSMSATSSSGLKPLWTGTNWMIAQYGGATTQVGDGLTFTSTGYEFNSIANIGGKVLGVNATGASLGQVTCTLLDSDGTLSAVKPDLNVGVATTGAAVIDSDGLTVGLAAQQDLGATNRRVLIRSTGDAADTWDVHPTPFPDFSGPLANVLKIHYAPILNKWVVCARDRVAIGDISSLVLEPMTFPSEITGIDSDGYKVIVCGGAGMLYAWTPADGWESLSGGEGRSIMDVVAFGIPVEGVTTIPDSPGSYVDNQGNPYVPGGYSTLTPCSSTTIGEVIEDLCQMSGLDSSQYDVSDLVGSDADPLIGYVVARETDAASVIESLRPVGMFDPSEWDGKVRFIKRGGFASGSINDDDLVQRDGDSIEREVVQEAELLRRVSTGYIDPAAGYSPNTQKWERRAGTVEALGESTFEVSAVIDADHAATVSKRKVYTAWGEPEKQKFSLPYRLSKYTPTDVLNYTDADGEVHTLRIMKSDEDSGVRLIESQTNAAEAYDAIASGVAPNPPSISDPGLFGPTILVPMNLDSLRAQDNVPGMYLAACGLLAGWKGCVVELSTDGGVTFRTIATISAPATMGYMSSNVGPATEPIRVTLYPEGELSSASLTSNGISAGINLAAIMTDDVGEVIQFQTATALGSNAYDLTNVERGVNDTVPANHFYPDPFVILDGDVIFVPIDVSFAGQTLIFRAFTSGTSPDAAEEISVVYEPPTFVLDGGGA